MQPLTNAPLHHPSSLPPVADTAAAAPAWLLLLLLLLHGPPHHRCHHHSRHHCRHPMQERASAGPPRSSCRPLQPRCRMRSCSPVAHAAAEGDLVPAGAAGDRNRLRRGSMWLRHDRWWRQLMQNRSTLPWRGPSRCDLLLHETPHAPSGYQAVKLMLFDDGRGLLPARGGRTAAAYLACAVECAEPGAPVQQRICAGGACGSLRLQGGCQ